MRRKEGRKDVKIGQEENAEIREEGKGLSRTTNAGTERLKRI